MPAHDLLFFIAQSPMLLYPRPRRSKQLSRCGIIQSQMDIHEGTKLVAKIGQGMLAIEMLVADSPVYDRKAVLVISKAILAKAMPPGGAPGLYGLIRSYLKYGPQSLQKSLQVHLPNYLLQAFR